MSSVKKQSLELKRKLTPLYLLSKLKKNNQFIADKETALSLMEREQKKINNRYGELINRRASKTQPNNNSDLGENAQLNRSTQSKSMLSKVEEILTKSSKKGRFYSVKKERVRDGSPYLSQEKRRLQIHDESQDRTVGLRQKFIKRIKLQGQQPRQSVKTLQKQRQLTKSSNNLHKIFIHFANLYKIDEIIEHKKNQKQIIELVKSYVLEEQGDSAQIQNLYTEPQVREMAKKLLFLEKVLVIIVVDLVINKKIRLTEMFLRICFKMVFKFYRAVYKDLDRQGTIKNQLTKIYSPATKLLTQPETQQKYTQSFTHIFECFQSKMRTCFKYCRHIEKYYYQHKKLLQAHNPNLSYYRLLEFYSQSLLGSNWLSWNIQFLEVCPSPYLHHEPTKKYTLVLDLDQTLIHYKMGNASNNYQGEFLIRPHMFQFLQDMSQFYEVGIFTCSLPQYADIIINHMKHIEFRLYRHHTIRVQGEYLKDLSRIGRDLSSLIIVDNLQHNFKLQKNNGIHIRSWYGDRNDDMLKKVGSELKRVAIMNYSDLREAKFQRKFL